MGGGWRRGWMGDTESDVVVVCESVGVRCLLERRGAASCSSSCKAAAAVWQHRPLNAEQSHLQVKGFNSLLLLSFCCPPTCCHTPTLNALQPTPNNNQKQTNSMLWCARTVALSGSQGRTAASTSHQRAWQQHWQQQSRRWRQRRQQGATGGGR